MFKYKLTQKGLFITMSLPMLKRNTDSNSRLQKAMSHFSGFTVLVVINCQHKNTFCEL